MGIAILIGVIIIDHQLTEYQNQPVDENKKGTQQLLESLLSRRESRVDTIASSIIGFYHGSQSVDAEEFQAFNKIILQENPEIVEVFILQENKIIQSYPDEHYIGSDFDLTFVGYPVKINGINVMNAEYVISDNLKVIISVPFDYFIPHDFLPFSNYKLILYSPVDENIELFQIEKNKLEEKLEGVEFSDEQLQNSLTIDKVTSLYGHKIQQNYDLKYVVWSSSFEKQNVVYTQIIIGSGIATVIIIPLLLLKSSRLAEILKKQSIKLQQANEELKKIDTLKDEFVSMVSHELMTPITPILLCSEMLLRCKKNGELDEKQRKDITKIYNNAKNLGSLIQDFLDINKLELKKLKLNNVNVEIKEFLENLIENLKSYTLEKNISLVLELEKSWTVTCDPKRISQVISNLIKNAVDFVPQDGKITLRVQQMDNSDTMFTVEDNGSGIPSEKTDNLFKKFYKADTSLSRKHGGTGLGLAICQGIIEAHGGKIWLDKNYKNGARFQFILPKVAG